MMVRNSLGAVAMLAMLFSQVGCEYYDEKPSATLDGSKAVTQGASDDKVSEISKQIEDLKKEMASSNAEEIKALEDKIAELEKKLAEAQAAGTEGGGTASPGTCPTGYSCDVSTEGGSCSKMSVLCKGTYKTQGTCGTTACPGTCWTCTEEGSTGGDSAVDYKTFQVNPSTVGMLANTIQPTVVSTDPVNDAKDHGVTKPITITFSKAMDGSTMYPNFTLHRYALLFEADATKEGTWAYNSGTKAFTWTPKDSWAGEKTMIPGCYKFELKPDVKDVAGNKLDKKYEVAFSTDAVKDCITFLCGDGAGKIPNCPTGFSCVEGQCQRD